MLLWFCYLLVTFIFLVVAEATVYIGGFVTVLLFLAIAGCFILNALASWRIFLDPQRGFRNALTGCLLMLPLFSFVLLPTFGIPMVVILFVMYYTKTMVRKDPSSAQMLRHTDTWRVKWANGVLALLVTFVLLVYVLGSFKVTRNIFPIEGNAIILWR